MQVVTNGLCIGLTYVLIALGFTVVFGIMGVVNYAHGEFYMLGAFLCLTFMTMGASYPLALVLAVVTVACLGALMEKYLLDRFRSNLQTCMIICLGLSTILKNSALVLWGAHDRSLPFRIDEVLTLGSLIFPVDRLVVVAASILLLGCFNLLLKRTKLGLSIRAIAQDAEVACAFSMQPSVVLPLTFAISAGLAAFAGGIVSPVFSLSYDMGVFPLMKSFIVVILGGLGSIPGAFVAGVLIGLIESFASTMVGGAASDIVAFVITGAVLVLRPQGLFGKKVRVG
jgi:branched-chain amino acid transport system permease protein